MLILKIIANLNFEIKWKRVLNTTWTQPALQLTQSAQASNQPCTEQSIMIPLISHINLVRMTILAAISNFGPSSRERLHPRAPKKIHLYLIKNKRSSGCKYACISLRRARRSSEKCLRAGFTAKSAQLSRGGTLETVTPNITVRPVVLSETIYIRLLLRNPDS